MGSGRILVIDDSPESLKLLSGALSAEGYDVRPADSGDLALASVSLNPPELILLDIRMPGMSGLEVCRNLKSRPETRDIPIIFLSASLDFEDRLEGLESGAVDFISKPFRREELLTRLKTHLELVRFRKELEHRVAERTADLKAANDRLEDELRTRRKIEEELRDSEHRFRSIADTAPAGICLFDKDVVPTYANHWLLTFCGKSLEEIVSEGWQQMIHPEDAGRLVEEVAAARDQQRSTQVEQRLRRYDGEYRWVAATAHPRFVHDQFAGHIVIILDITEMKLSQERALANQKLESLGVLAAGIAHDFHNFLGAILAHSELALQEIAVESPAHENVSSISTVAVRASEIVRLMTAYAGQTDLDALKAVDFSSLIDEMVQLLQVSIPRTTNLDLHLAKDLPQVWASAPQLRQVVLNLIVNASEALEEKPGKVVVSTSLARVCQASTELQHLTMPDGDYVLLEVSDGGCGMTEETKTRIFDPFFSTKYLGRGMGLAAVQGIVRRVGGRISVASAPGKGSTFKIWLPCSDRKIEGPFVTARPLGAPVGMILLVDDEDGLRVAGARALRREGFSVLEAQDGLAAVQLFALHAGQISLVVLDMTLPGLSGSDVCDEIRRLCPHVPVLLTSAQSSTATEEPATRNFQRFLAKPYRLRELVQTVREMLASTTRP